ncbi:MAG: C40 family peptidase [Gammaproteobacteria bacterium]
MRRLIERPATFSEIRFGYRPYLCLLVGALLQGGCTTSPPAPAPLREVRLPDFGPAAETTAATFDRLGLVAYATSMQGKPYRLSGASPEHGFDCSGLVYHVFSKFELFLPRSATRMADSLPKVPNDEIAAADLLFFDTQGTPHSHVGIYLGDGRFVHAPSPRTGRVIISNIANSYWQRRFSGARRPVPQMVAHRESTLSTHRQ